jgi:predicted metal-dependent hydrolase
VEDDGRVRVTVPRWGSKREAAAFAEQERAWIEKQRARVARDRARPRAEPVPQAAAAAAATGRDARADGHSREHPQSALALGVVLAERPHLSELAARADA